MSLITVQISVLVIVGTKVGLKRAPDKEINLAP